MWQLKRQRVTTVRERDRTHCRRSTTPTRQHGLHPQDLRVRTVSSLVMVSSFAACIVLGQQSGCALLVALLQLGVFKVRRAA
jgi:hypothetical protein